MRWALACLVLCGCTMVVPVKNLPGVVKGPVDAAPNVHVLIRCPIKDGGRTIVLLEKYGPRRTVDSVTLVMMTKSKYYVTRKGKQYGVFPVANYGLIIEEE